MTKIAQPSPIKRVSIETLLICDLAQITQDGKINIIGVFERIQAKSLPIRYPRFFIIGILSGEPLSNHSVSFSVIDPRGKQIIQQLHMDTTLGYNGKANVLNELTGVIFEDAGIYTMTMVINESLLRTYQFEIIEASKERKLATQPVSN